MEIKLTKNDILSICLLMLIFWLGAMRHVNLPGFYMDSVNPDYLAARTLNPALNNPAWTLPTSTFPILGNLYHGVQNYYVDLAVFRFMGISVASVRIAQAVFGATIVVLLYLLTMFVTRNRVAAFVGAALLATDIAFLASFRTQFYIILGGQTWLFASLLALWIGRRGGFFLSGVCFGLAIYGYFVLGFFAPAMAVLVLGQPDRRPIIWICGFVIGMLPYVAGYASLVDALGGLNQAADWLRNAIHALAPTSSKQGVWESIQYMATLAYEALTNVGNEAMIFNQPVSGIWAPIKVAILVAFAAIAVIRIPRSRAMLLALLPISYLIAASFFGHRLWVHHLSVMVALAYLLLAIVLGELSGGGRRASIAILLCAAVFAAGNMHQANNFHRVLSDTGGTRMTTDALTRFAEAARSEPDTLYVFPDWGFFMPFELLTENRVPFTLDVSQIGTARGRASHVVIAFWSETDQQKYRDVLTQAGVQDVSSRIYRRRDGQPAFWVVSGAF